MPRALPKPKPKPLPKPLLPASAPAAPAAAAGALAPPRTKVRSVAPGGRFLRSWLPLLDGCGGAGKSTPPASGAVEEDAPPLPPGWRALGGGIEGGMLG